MKMVSLVVLFLFIFTHTDVWAGSEKDCENYNHPAYQEEYRQCLKLQIAKSAGDAGVDCIDCLFEQDTTGSKSFVEALGVIAQPLAFLAATYSAAKFQNKTQQVWADAYKTGYAECTNRFNSYLDYSTSIGANPMTNSNASLLSSCNGNGYGAYAGYGGYTNNGYGGYGNPFQVGGYSTEFMSGYGGTSWPSINGSINSSGMYSASMGVGAYGTSSSAAYQSGITAGFSF